MVIIPEAEAVFIHIPRTGGTSLHHALTKRFKSAIAYYHADSRHRTVYEVPQEYADYYRFSVMRNPWEIIRSHYGLLHRMNIDDELRAQCGANTLEFAKAVSSMPFCEAVPVLLRRSLTMGGAYATYCNATVEVFRMEDGPLNAICDRLGIDSLDVGHLNASLIDKPMYNNLAMRQVARHCWRDVQMFHYLPPEG